MEKVLYLKTISQLKNYSVLRDYDRLYVGSEFCISFIPNSYDLDRFFSLCMKYNLLLSLVLPFCVNADFKFIKKILKKISDWQPNTEIIINDLGQLWILEKEFPRFQRIWGRLLTKMKADDGLKDNKRREYQLISADQEYLSELLIQHKIKRVELNNIKQGIQREKNVTVLTSSLYIPYVYMATSRNCLSQISVNPTPDIYSSNKLYSGDCARPCQNFYARVSKNRVISGNTIFYINSHLPSNIKELKIDRIVTEKLPFEEI